LGTRKRNLLGRERLHPKLKIASTFTRGRGRANGKPFQKWEGKRRREGGGRRSGFLSMRGGADDEEPGMGGKKKEKKKNVGNRWVL